MNDVFHGPFGLKYVYDTPAHPQPSLLTPPPPPLSPTHTMHMQVLRVVPYSAAQLYSYELFKKHFADEEGKLTVPKRLAAGALAGMTATLVRAKNEFSTIGESKATSFSAYHPVSNAQSMNAHTTHFTSPPFALPDL
jgi:hypothetical protein